ncbi:hypothetical protein FB45DRAFT_876756 [Roridomyces roridus]|uniref:Uncharacterized protein n=1 Tax=Roridomyces roridus TaxID=1738132 RepID=A0AAD7B346_9AGAR|nr:hypothetical protein FB45DRAFT_876756 [Roridomyces roridus]
MSPNNFFTVYVPYPYDGYLYMGAIIGNPANGNNFGSGTSNSFAFLGKSDPVPEGPPSTATGNSYRDSITLSGLGVETALWSYDTATTVRTPTWINENGDRVTAYVMYDNWNGAFFITGQSPLLAPGLPISPDPVTFTCVLPVPLDD